jgi:SAM-dependent methyltransferase
MDAATLSAYDTGAAAFAQDWHEQPPPADLHDIVRRFFRPGATADIGCGSGRDVAWLSANGFPTVGYDPSAGLLAQARARYVDLAFHSAALPTLEGIADTSFVNVLCETVIMHLPREDVAPSVRRLMAILAPAGTLYLSWRVTPGADLRDGHGRLYGAFDADIVHRALGGATVLLDEEALSASSGKVIHRLVARKAAHGMLMPGLPKRGK